ncbi:ankyrin repeat-containing protein ITN1 isoform X2 [Prunus persica]|uniref:ankyrin repeat-containing protein ITN1 isoform X2 n=1 Tax=Prunus persica TaxID=3760 RepID=UPI0009AB8905|nr:ankyrin repeat-containing protein ITN1 isoform X2 [Prunus persica]
MVKPVVPADANSSSNPGHDDRVYDYNQCKPLFDAVCTGDWNKAKEFLTLHPNAIRARLTSANKIALHYAAELEHEHIVEELVQLMSEEDLELTDKWGWTALAYAAKRANLKMVECMVRKSKKILSIPNGTDNMTPILLASFQEQWDVVHYLYSATPLQDLMPEKGPYGSTILRSFIIGMKFGIALELIQHCPQLVLTKGHDGAFPMEGFMPSAFLSGTRLKFWQRWIYNCIRIEHAISDIRVSVQNEGNDECNRMKITWSKNCALHVAGILSPLAKLDNISGAALQMQREVQWFKEVETIALPRIKESINNDSMTPRELFTKSHKELVKEGERWMKESATSCTVVGALIITIMFAAAFTVPGGNNEETGFPIFLHKNLFMAFIVSDAVSLFSSTTSVLMFLGILTSRYAEDDFLKSLPTKMIIGLSTLFISIATMMVAFSSALFIMIHEQSWIVIPMIFLASVPVTLFIWMQFPLLVEMYISTYGGGIFDKKVKSRA